jgi:hypothetical protein
MKVEKSIADFIQKTVKEIQSGLPDGYELTDEISFDISVVTTESDKGKIDIKIASFGMEGGNQSVHTISFGVVNSKALEQKEQSYFTIVEKGLKLLQTIGEGINNQTPIQKKKK